jgi:hypothetical protein
MTNLAISDDDIHAYEKKCPMNWKLLEKLADDYLCQARHMIDGPRSDEV